MKELDPKTLEAAARALISTHETDGGVEVSLPVVYPSGQAVSVVVTMDRGGYVVHDASIGSMYLTSMGVKMTKRLREKLDRYARAYGCEFLSGRVSTTCTVDQVAVAMVLVANASRAIGDEGRVADELTAASFDKKVGDALREIVGQRLREREQIVGNSGKTYRIGHVVLDSSLSEPQIFVESIANESVVPQRVAEFFDLRDEYPSIAREAVYDDSRDWGAHHIVLIGKVSNPVPFATASNRFRALQAV
ncbi:hypothetical protein [uncultured Rhodospira sp.]|uniref:hypothetical protein n=1 Tax=uncultured Rhodospira sp. TaxID=1936189 RepID=UPI00261F38E4|nr:hypothetical protein [uncultured Rhodospira sp.]